MTNCIRDLNMNVHYIFPNRLYSQPRVNTTFIISKLTSHYIILLDEPFNALDMANLKV